MQIDWTSPEQWFDLNRRVARELGLADKGGATQVMAGVRAAIVEVAVGLARQFPHKRKVWFLKSFDPTLETVTLTLAREGCALHPLTVDEVTDGAALTAKIDADTLMVIASEEDPMLARLLDLGPLERTCDSKKVCLLRVSHSHHRYLPRPEAKRYVVHICGLGPRLALVSYAQRLRWPIQFADAIGLPQDAFEQVLQLKTQDCVNPHLIERFEDARPAEGLPVLPRGTARVADRAILYWPDVDGWALATRVSEKLALKLPPAGEATPLETTSLNRWRGVRTMDWLRGHGFTDAMIRGTLIFDHRLLDASLVKALEESRNEILAIQRG